MRLTIYHNPRCSSSRATLALIREHGIEPEIVDYLNTPPDRATLVDLLRRLGMGPRGLLRTRQPDHAVLGLDNPAVSDEQVIDAILAHPVLIERPVVVSGARALICRPPERVLELLGALPG